MANTFKFGNKQWYGKKGSVLAYNDENNNFKPLPFDFTRSSSATRVNKDGLIEVVGSDEPRVDYLNNADGHLLLEPSRENKIAYSEYINASVSSWSSFFDTVITNNDAISPDGENNATKIACPSGGTARLDAIASSVSAGTYTYSFYAKGNVSNLDVNVYQDATGATLSTTAIETLINDSEWSRVTITFTSTALSTIRLIYANLTSGESFYMWGCQLEQGSYATSYIPTSGSSVTRAVDACSQTVPNGIIGQIEGTILVDFIRKPQSNGTAGLFGISSSNNNDRVIIWNNFSLDGLGLQIKANGSNISGNQSLGTFDDGENYKIAISYKSGEIKVYVNGSSILNLTDSFTFASDINTVIVNSYQLGIVNEPSPFKDLKLYNTALTDSELIALTSN